MRVVAGIEECVVQVAGVDEVLRRLDEVGVPVDDVEPLAGGQGAEQVALAHIHPVGYPVPLNVAPRVLHRGRADVQGRHPPATDQRGADRCDSGARAHLQQRAAHRVRDPGGEQLGDRSVGRREHARQQRPPPAEPARTPSAGQGRPDACGTAVARGRSRAPSWPAPIAFDECEHARWATRAAHDRQRTGQQHPRLAAGAGPSSAAGSVRTCRHPGSTNGTGRADPRRSSAASVRADGLHTDTDERRLLGPASVRIRAPPRGCARR